MMKKIMLFAAILLAASTNINSQNGFWRYYKFNELSDEHERHYARKSRLENYVEIKNGEYIGTLNMGANFKVPDAFIAKTLHHLRTLIEQNHVNYLFYPDLNHGHLFLPNSEMGKHKSGITSDSLSKFFAMKNWE